MLMRMHNCRAFLAHFTQMFFFILILFSIFRHTQQTFTYLKSTIETLEMMWNLFKVNNTE